MTQTAELRGANPLPYDRKGEKMTKEEKEYIINHRTALIRVCQDKGILLIEFSTDAARSSVSKYFEKDFGFVSSEKEVGELSASKKRIFRADVASSDGLDACRIKQIADHLKAAKVEVRYRLGEEENLHSDWESYVQSLCKNLPTPKEQGYRLQPNEYGNVNAFDGFPDGWHETTLTVTQLKKAQIPTYKACTGFSDDYGSHPKPVLVNIIPDDFSEQETAYLARLKEKQEKENQKTDSLPITPELIAECLYSINKEAKRYRDIQSESRERAYGLWGDRYPGVHYQLHRAKNIKNELYDLKEKALAKAVSIWKLKPEGYHDFPDRQRDMYVFGGYTFHANTCISENSLGKIEKEIESNRKRSIPPKKAERILNRFLNWEPK